ncbi:MAG: PH domain-containing protein [Alphaproteobacteria bacterium]
MSYIDKTLTSDEKLVYKAHYHWFYTAIAWFWLILWAGISVATLSIGKMIFGSMGSNGGTHTAVLVIALVVAAVGAIRFLGLMINRYTTEVVITSRRLVYKRGWIAINVDEFNINRIEGININQSILGRILGYGQVDVRGLGVGEIYLPTLAEPEMLRKALQIAANPAELNRI